ncbi:MAG: hypothetical protein QM765_27115 [Myxococcales bacterium]
MKRLSAVVAACVCLLSLGGCKNKCLELAQRICECEATSTLRDNCNQRASDQGNKVTVSPQDEENCAKLIDGDPANRECDCHALDTTEGKLNCGMARQP